MLSKEDQELIDEYYVATITDFCNGITIDVLQEVLALYEDEGNYLACAGMKKAIDSLNEVIIKESYDA
jgi:hypothetical protein